MEARACMVLPGLADWSSPVAMQGTWGHAVIAQTLALIYHSPTRQDQGEALAKMAGALERLEPWTRDAVRRCVAYAVALIDQAEASGVEVVVQIEIHLSGKGIDIGRGGTADLVLLLREPLTRRVLRVVVIDWKLGYLDQGEAADHLQLAAYTVMAWDKYAPTDSADVHLGQGRRRDFTAGRYLPAVIEGARARCRAVVAGALVEDPAINPSIDACRYCKSLTFCRAARARVHEAIEQADMFGTIDPQGLALARRLADAAADIAALWRQHPPTGQVQADPRLFGDSNEDRAQLAADAAEARRMVKSVRGAA
ncbi:MAG: hypothetical protein RLZZ127_38 [Planctomycetota bacterium]|jgi:hypothetical protein